MCARARACVCACMCTRASVCMPRIIERRGRQREKKREEEEEKRAKRKIEVEDKREAKRKPKRRDSGVCSLLPDDRVHRLLLVVSAPKSRIFDSRTGATRRDSLFH